MAEDAPWPDIADPPSVWSRDGVTTVALTATNQPVRIGQVIFPGGVLNGVYSAPVSRRVHIGTTPICMAPPKARSWAGCQRTVVFTRDSGAERFFIDG
jgi:hypothetical protein